MTVTLEEPETLELRRIVRSRLTIATGGPGFTDLTAEIDRFLQAAAAEEGMVTLFIRHTSASLTIQENVDADVLADLTDSLSRLAPESPSYRHGIEGPDDMPGHIKTMLTDVSLAVPVSGGRMALGTYQGIFLVEHRARGRQRTVALTYLGG